MFCETRVSSVCIPPGRIRNVAAARLIPELRSGIIWDYEHLRLPKGFREVVFLVRHGHNNDDGGDCTEFNDGAITS